MATGLMTKDETQFERRPVKLTGSALAIMAFQTLGVIYSDIGTSPLYVLNGIWPSSGPVPSTEDVIGGVSAIVWSMTLLPLIKYSFIALHFGTGEGEGGTFALLQGLYPRSPFVEFDRTLTSDSAVRARSDVENRRGLEFLKQGKWPLYFWSLFGTALTLGDGVLTPAVSVTSAVGGLAVAKPSVINHIISISIAILVVLFLVQRFGTNKITLAFAPVTFIWLALIGVSGIYNITAHPGIFRALDPSRAVMWFVRTKKYDNLAGVLLAITGCEALFANLGQFNALSIRLSFTLFVFPCLILAYLGQGARVIADGEAVMSNIFYTTIPGRHNGPLYWIIWLFALLATIIASQAMITAVSSLTQQLINCKSFPPLRLVYTSSLVQGQVYVPAANYTLGLATVIVVAAFKNLTNMTNAYGFAVSTVMIVTSTFISFHIYIKKGLPIFVAIGFFLVFGFFDGLFFGASLRKVPLGAWVPLSIGCALCALMLFWTWAKGLEDVFDGENRRNPRHFIINRDSAHIDEKGLVASTEFERPGAFSPESHDPRGITHNGEADSPVRQRNRVVLPGEDTIDAEAEAVDEKSQELVFYDDVKNKVTTLSRIPTCAIFYKLAPGPGVPHSFYGYIRQMPALPRVVIFLSFHVVPVPYVAADDAYAVTKVRSIQGFYGVTYCLGFRDDFNPSTDHIFRAVHGIESRVNPSQARQILDEIKEAADQTVHIIPHYYVISKQLRFSPEWAANAISWIRRLLIESIYRRLATMFPETANWGLQQEDTLYVGVNALI
ncbi:potassium transporter [Cantharellus anzutake]|uniref:potassium transporter n=1 Tax=Cantharellus anzutake TaxID=1750568 RepID=UPI001906D322|nr:potassium transporter [Cantharellus anzutake]KAF8329370.1 potassium transporter [Cantharellus anzutake]